LTRRTFLLFCALISVIGLSYADEEFWCDGGAQQATLTDSLNSFILGTNLATWKYNHLWGSDECPCSWYGVICSSSNTTVKLNLADNEIYGTISPLFCSNIYSSIDLNNNELFSKIPSCLGDMQHLDALHLSNNSFQGLLPDSLGNLLKLEHLDISKNEFAGPFPDYIQCPDQFFSSKAKLEISDNKFWCPSPNWCKSPPTGNGQCSHCEDEPSQLCTNKNKKACDTQIVCCYESSWNATTCEDIINKTNASCTSDLPPITCPDYRPPSGSKSSDSGIDLTAIWWTCFTVGIIFIILAVGLFAIFLITLKKRQWSFKAVKNQLIKVDSETYMMDPDDDIYQDEMPPRSSLDYEL